MALRCWCLLGVVLFLATPVAGAGKVTFDAAEVVRSDGPANDARSLRTFEVRLWERWLRQDRGAFLAMLSPEVSRFSGRAPGPQRGTAQVERELKREWSAFERPGGIISEDLRLKHAVFRFDGEFATAEYSVSVKGGSRWSYTDQGLVFQVLKRKGDSWTVVHQVDSWSLDYDPSTGRPGQESVSFSFVYPAADLARAARFYRPLLGAPESATSERCVFNLDGMRFILEHRADIRRGWPNGHGMFLVPDLAAWRGRLKVTRQGREGGDPYLVSADSAGNLFTLLQVARVGRPSATVRGVLSKEVRRVLDAWLRRDSAGMSKSLSPTARWFDDTRLRTRGVETGAQAVVRAARPAACRSAGRPTGMCASTRAVSQPHTDSSIHAAMPSDCEYSSCVSTTKKPRKNSTSASRRARSSSVFIDSSATSSATPASLPSSVRSLQ